MQLIETALAYGYSELKAGDSPHLDAQLLLAHILGKGRHFLYAWPQCALSAEQLRRFRELCRQRKRGVPVAYLIGTRDFWDLKLAVKPGVFIPRPETECLVEAALEKLGNDRKIVAELGTGSGAIAIALAAARPNWEIWATDQSPEALDLARRNVAANGVDKVRFAQGDWMQPLRGRRFDAIISNPPYIAAQDPHLQRGELRFEPRTALLAADDGLAHLKTLIRQAHGSLQAGGWLLLEHGWRQGRMVREDMTAQHFGAVEKRLDLAGHERVAMGQKS